MNRLVQGDVGSGKTIVAILGLLTAALNGEQGVLMAPTEVLARQHYEDICELIKKNNLNLKVAILVGSMKVKEKREAYEAIETGYANIIIGTHALIQEKVKYRNLALVVTDEQHRFGVKQRETIAEKGDYPHTMVMGFYNWRYLLLYLISQSLYSVWWMSRLSGISDRRPISVQLRWEDCCSTSSTGISVSCVWIPVG